MLSYPLVRKFLTLPSQVTTFELIALKTLVSTRTLTLNNSKGKHGKPGKRPEYTCSTQGWSHELPKFYTRRLYVRLVLILIVLTLVYDE